MGDLSFYGAEQASIHHRGFGELARRAGLLLRDRLLAAGHRDGMVVDLGCGTGILARLLSDAGYAVLGVDISPGMLALAAGHAPAASLRCSPLLDVDLPRSVAVAATGEVLNYATDPRAGLEEVDRLARRVREALEPGGVFLFDVATPGRAGPDGVRQQFHDQPDWTLYMRAEEDRDRATLERWITIFTRTEGSDYRRTDERHVLRLYEPRQVVALLEGAGFGVEVLEDYPASPPQRSPLPGWKVFVATAPG